MAEQRNGLLLLAWATCFLLGCIFAGCAGDVPDGVVYTDLHKTVKKGDSVTLKCEFRGEPIAVYWKKEIGKGQWEELIVWVEETMLSGSCLADESCEMNQDFSLNISNVQIANRGRYMCRISNYLGILIDNYTDVNTYAPPEEPYPIIKECTSAQNPNSSQMCSIPANNTPMDITCSASNYFPDLNLFFLHGSVKISNTDSKEWTNEDGTKNKYISIKGSGSEKPYVCVASDIPGSTDERTATVFLLTVTTPSATYRSSYPFQTTTPSVERTDPAGGVKSAKIAVPIIVIFLAGGALLIACRWLKRRRITPTTEEKDVGETEQMLQKIKETVSFYELRSLLYNMKTPDMNKLHKLIKELGEVVDVEAGLGPQQVYEALCRWKEKRNKGDQAEILRDALEKADLSEAWLKIEETRQDTARVSEGALNHILLQIRDPTKIQQFIVKLVSGTVIHQNASDNNDVIHQAMEILRDWSKGPFHKNPMILLSRALESSGCNPVDRTFFYRTISYFELWSLVNHSNENDMRTLSHALHALGIQDVQDTKAIKPVYVLLSEWKNQHHACDQLLALKMLLVEAGLLKLFEDLHDRRNRTDTKISDDTLEHVLWHVKDPNEMYNFLLELRQISREPSLGDSKPAGGITRAAALKELKQWKEGLSDENQIVQVSLALERAKCSPVDRTFFKVPIQLQKPIEKAEVKMFVNKLTSRHCKRLANRLSTTDEKRVLDISDENNEVLFDTMSMISEWIANVECSNYEKRCRLDAAVINIGRHDMTDSFRTIAYWREIAEDLTQPHPASNYFNHDRIFDDDLISLAKLMSCPNAEIMSSFCTSVGISDHVKERDKRRPLEQVLRAWRDSNLTSETNGSLESVFSLFTELMGDKTYVKYVTDDELRLIETQLRTDDRKENILSALHIGRDNKKKKWTMKRTWLRKKQELPDRQDEETDSADDDSVSEGKQDEVETNVPNVKDRKVGLVFLDLLKEWRNHFGGKSCRKKLRTVLKTVGMEECIANKTPRKYMYKAELGQVAFNLLMTDVLPIIHDLGIDQRKANKYRRQNLDVEKGSLYLLIQLCQGKKELEAYIRSDFLPILLKFGYVDAAKSLYLDFGQSLCELSSIVSRLEKDEFQSFIKELGISSDELPECSGTDEEAYREEVMRIWKSQIRPVPYHYRMQVVTDLRAIGCGELANKILSGLYRVK